MALLTAVVLVGSLTPPNPHPYVVILGVLSASLAFAWFILFPNGKLAPRWSWVFIFFLLPNILYSAILDLGILSYDSAYVTAYMPINVLSSLGGLGIVGVIVFRYRRVFSPPERQQSKWIIVPLLVGLVPLMILSLLSTSFWNSAQVERALRVDFVNSIINAVMVSLLIFAVLFSIFKYRLYDVDTVVSRAIVYSSLTAILALVGFAVVPLINYALTQVLGNQSGLLAVMISALPIAGLFNPVRERLQQAVERRFKPEEMNFEKTFIEFTPDFRSQFTVKELSTLLVQHAVEQLDIAYAGVFLNGKNGELKHITTIHSDQEASEPSLDEKTMKKISKGELASPDGDYAKSLIIPLVVPRSRKPSLLGALFLGPRLQGVGYSTSMVKSLKKFGEEVGKALYAAEVKNNKKQTLLETE